MTRRNRRRLPRLEMNWNRVGPPEAMPASLQGDGPLDLSPPLPLFHTVTLSLFHRTGSTSNRRSPCAFPPPLVRDGLPLPFLPYNPFRSIQVNFTPFSPPSSSSPDRLWRHQGGR